MQTFKPIPEPSRASFLNPATPEPTHSHPAAYSPSPTNNAEWSLAYAPGLLSGWALLWTMLGIFVGGMALTLTPCVYPLLPITVSYFGGKSGPGQRRLVAHGLFFLAGRALTNSILGVAAAITGGLMGPNPARSRRFCSQKANL
jgi:thiol:disulfide interchange protein